MLLPPSLLAATTPPEPDDAAAHAPESHVETPLQGLNPPLSPDAAPAPEQAEEPPGELPSPLPLPYLLESPQDPPAPVPAEETPLPPPPREEEPFPLLARLGRAGFVLGLVLFVAMLGYWLAPDSSPEGPDPASATSLFESAARAQRTVREVERLNDPARAATYVRERFGQGVRIPQIAGASLSGVGTARIGALDVPTLVFDENGDHLRVLIFSYALLERYPHLLNLAPQTLNRLVSAAHVEAVGRQQALLWRDRDDLFLAFTPDAEAFRQRVQMR